MTSYSIHLTAPAVGPGLPVQEGGFSPLLPQTACANHFSTVQTHPSVGPCCLDPPQEAFHVFSCSVHFQVLKPLGSQGTYPSSPPCQPQPMSHTPRDGHSPAAPCLGRCGVTGTETPAASLLNSPSTRIPSAWALGRHNIPNTGGRAPSKDSTSSNVLHCWQQELSRWPKFTQGEHQLCLSPCMSGSHGMS